MKSKITVKILTIVLSIAFVFFSTSSFAVEINVTASVSLCGDGICSSGECAIGCIDDCSISDCCNTVLSGGCDSAIGETCSNCPQDCGICPTEVEGVPIIPIPPAEIKVNVTRGRANITIPSIAAGKKANVSIERIEDLAFREITISVVNSVNNVKIEIRKLPKLPPEVKIEVIGKVYHYISLEKKNIRDEDIANATINFEVLKSWIRENSINETTISLYRWDNEWIKLPTQKIKGDEEFVYFKSLTKKLSIFAISGEEIKLLPPKLECPPCPKPTEWSACIEGKQKRTNYRCSEETNYTCQPYPEERACEIIPKPLTILEQIITYWYLIILVVVITTLIIIIWKIKR